MGSIANVDGSGGNAIGKGWCGGMCVESACGDCVDINIHAGAGEGGLAVAAECAKGLGVNWIGDEFDGGDGGGAGAERRREGVGCGSVCAEGAGGNGVDSGANAGAGEGGPAVAAEGVKGWGVSWIGGEFKGGGGCEAGIVNVDVARTRS